MKLATLLRISAAIALAFAILPATSLAETFTATGTVTDANGDPVSGAKVSLIDDSYNILAETMTDANGNFQFANEAIYGSSIVKACVTFVHDGRNYSTRLENVNWIDVSQGTVILPLNDTRLYDYPLSDHGYVWGTVMERLPGGEGRGINAMVYLDGFGIHRSVQAGNIGLVGGFRMEVPTGEYVIHAVYDTGDCRLVSNRTRISVQPSHSVFESAPINLYADQKPAAAIEFIPFAMAIVLSIAMIAAFRALLNKK